MNARRCSVGLLLLWLVAAGCRQDVPLPPVSSPPDGPPRTPRDASVWELAGGTGGTGASVRDAGDDVMSDAGAALTCRRTSGFRQENPQVILAVDRSGSMMTEKPTGGTVSRLAALQLTLVRLMRVYRPAIYFGYVEFPMTACRDGGTCCSGNFLPPAPYPIDSIESRWACPQGGCPSREDEAPVASALRDARLYYDRADDTRGSRHVLLFTDGEPSCSDSSRAEACQEGVREVAQLTGTTNVGTTVFALRQDLTGNTCLNDMAGLGAQGGTLFAASDEATTRAQIEGVLKRLSAEACSFRLHQPLEPGYSIYLTLDDKELKRDPTRTEGWEFVEGSMSRFTVHGSWCDKLRASAVADVDVYLCSR